MKKILKPEEFDSALEQFAGAYAQLWLFHVSLKRLVIRLSSPGHNQALFIVAIACENMTTDFSWENAHIEIESHLDRLQGEAQTRIIDKGAGFELICGGVSLATGLVGGPDKSFEDFLED